MHHAIMHVSEYVTPLRVAKTWYITLQSCSQRDVWVPLPYIATEEVTAE